VAALFLLSFVRLKEDAGVVKQYKPETYEQSKAKARRFLSLQSLLTPISGGGVLLNKTSPQYKALDWLANADAAKLEPPSANDDNHNLYQLAQRYILAVLYFATGGPTHWEKDYNWLSGKHVCEWSDGGGIRKCDSNQQVMDISLCKYHPLIPSLFHYYHQEMLLAWSPSFRVPFLTIYPRLFTMSRE
jgi:hypothetical protein